MGCYAAFPMLKTPCDIRRSHPSARVLVVSVELCSLHFQQSSDTDLMVANSLFVDRAAAVLLNAACDPNVTGASRSHRRRLVFEHFATFAVPESEEDVAWKIGLHKFDMPLARYVPWLVACNVEGVLSRLLGDGGRTKGDVDNWAIHPKGTGDPRERGRIARADSRGDASLPWGYWVSSAT